MGSCWYQERWEWGAEREYSGHADVKSYRLRLEAGQILQADIDAYRLDAPGQSLGSFDYCLRILDSAGKELSYNDDAVDPDTGEYGVDPHSRRLQATCTM
jgi:hypothetical protein